MKIRALPALTDNYIWLLHNGCQAAVVDPSDATPVINALQAHGLTLCAILITHHHSDHTGGIEGLLPYMQGPRIYGPATEAVPHCNHPLGEGASFELLGLQVNVLDVPGHTAGHIAYHIPAQAMACGEDFSPVAFTGDALFSAGCGRLFEGTPAQMLHSLDKLAALPEETLLYCAHEYTLSNLRFAQAVEPENEEIARYTALCQQLRAEGEPTLPSQIKRELRINPFLRSRKSSIIEAVMAHDPTEKAGDVAIFVALRRWKDHF